MDDIMQGQIPNQPAANQRITTAQFASKYKSKREVYTFLTVDCKAYLPGYHTLTIYFMEDLMAGRKKSKSPQSLHINLLSALSSNPT